MANTFKETPPELRPALQGVARFSDTLNNRDAQLRSLLGNANKVSGVLGRRSQQIASLVADSNALLAALLDERDSLDALMNNLTAVSHQISGLVNDNRTQLKPALDKLNGVLEILDNRKEDLQRTLPKFKRYAMSFGEVLGSGPFFKAYVANLIPGQLGGPTIDARMYDRPLDPNQKLPSESVDPPTGTPPVPPEQAPHPIWSQPPSPAPAPGPPPEPSSAPAPAESGGTVNMSRRTLQATDRHQPGRAPSSSLRSWSARSYGKTSTRTPIQRISRNPTACSSATRFGSSASPSAWWTRSSRSPAAPR